MKYNKQFSTISQKDALDVLYQAAVGYNYDRLMYALTSKKHINFKEVEELTYEINNAIPIMMQEHNRLDHFSKGFVDAFFTDNNDLFNESLTSLHKLRRSVCMMKTIYEKLSPTLTQRRRDLSIMYGNGAPNLYTNSYLSSSTYQIFFHFDDEQVDSRITALSTAMQSFFDKFADCIKICKDIIKNVEEVRNDTNQCTHLFEDFSEEIIASVGDLLKFITDDYLSANNNPIIEESKKYNSLEAFLPHAYHKYGIEQGKKLVYKTLKDNLSGNDDMYRILEMAIFPKNSNTDAIRYVIKHFDEVCPKGQANKISTKHVAMFMTWAGVLLGKEKEFYEQYFGSLYHDKEKLTKYSALNMAKKKLLNHPDEQAYNIFVARINNLINITKKTEYA
ncbi:MAG: hypothetical protein J5663_03955 [Bacteroidaceae bacterium]|nr:hypothetical protein [Bacteroidaceae bacterium]